MCRGSQRGVAREALGVPQEPLGGRRLEQQAQPLARPVPPRSGGPRRELVPEAASPAQAQEEFKPAEGLPPRGPGESGISRALSPREGPPQRQHRELICSRLT